MAADLQNGRPQRRHWLAWVAHAAEVGYGYSGLEYWPSFAAKSPGWEDCMENRDWIRTQFYRFASEFNGIQPVGTWANQFTIICWPITHAVLPQDLQRQFVWYLDQLGARFTYEILKNPEQLGAVIEGASADATSRFRQFVTNNELVGLIASALLLQGTSPEHEVISHSALERIVEDLERRRQAKDSLERARHSARVAILGVGSGQQRLPGLEGHNSRSLLTRLGIEPDLVLRPVPDGRWSAFLQMSDMAPVATLVSADVRRALGESRFRIAGDIRARPRAADALMHGMADIELVKWPEPAVPLVRFETPNPLAEQLLDTRLCVGGGPTWLFRIRDDGEARLVKGRTVRSDGRYLLVAQGMDLRDLPIHAEVATFEDAALFSWSPAELTAAELEAVCARCALTLASTVRIWPVGLAPSSWDGEGRVEWLSSQPKLLAVESDGPTGALSLREVGFGAAALTAELSTGATAFIDLEPLELGHHEFEVSVDSGGVVRSGKLNVVVRAPSSGTAERALPMVVSPSPRNPSIEDMWAGRFSLEIDGPSGRLVRLRAKLCVLGSDSALVDCPLPSRHMPVSSEEWQDHFERHFIRNAKVQNAFDAADMCVLRVDGGELGSRTFVAEREPVPLRWVVSKARNSFCLELHDDRGEPTEPQVVRFEYAHPDASHQVDSAGITSGPCLDAVGGLYMATAGDYRCSIVVPAVVHELRDLSCSPTLRHYGRGASELLSLLCSLGYWGGARIPGQLSARYPLQQVLAEYERKLVEIVCGSNWARAERSFRDYPSSAAVDALADAVALTASDRRVSDALKANAAYLVDGSAYDRCERFATQVRLQLAFSPSPASAIPLAGGRGLLEFALRLGSSPETVLTWAGEDAERFLAGLLEAPVFLRAARWVVLNVDQVVGAPEFGRTHKSWEW